jgi:pimeloyl-ACP methyl ester carboxylesterase
VKVPTLVVRGGASHPAVQRANDLLGAWIPGASVIEIPGAAHFMISTHAKEMAGVIAEHVAGAEPARGSAAAAKG